MHLEHLDVPVAEAAVSMTKTIVASTVSATSAGVSATFVNCQVPQSGIAIGFNQSRDEPVLSLSQSCLDLALTMWLRKKKDNELTFQNLTFPI